MHLLLKKKLSPPSQDPTNILMVYLKVDIINLCVSSYFHYHLFYRYFSYVPNYTSQVIKKHLVQDCSQTYQLYEQNKKRSSNKLSKIFKHNNLNKTKY